MVFDAAPIGKRFGAVLVDVNSTPYHVGDTVSAQFVGANPRVNIFYHLIPEQSLILLQNNLRLESTFLTVDQLIDGQWMTVRSDSQPSTIYQWVRVNTVSLVSSSFELGRDFAPVDSWNQHCHDLLVSGAFDHTIL